MLFFCVLLKGKDTISKLSFSLCAFLTDRPPLSIVADLKRHSLDGMQIMIISICGMICIIIYHWYSRLWKIQNNMTMHWRGWSSYQKNGLCVKFHNIYSFFCIFWSPWWTIVIWHGIVAVVIISKQWPLCLMLQYTGQFCLTTVYCILHVYNSAWLQWPIERGTFLYTHHPPASTSSSSSSL